MFGVFKIKNGGFIIKSYEGETVDSNGNISNQDYSVCVVNPKYCARVEHAVYVFTIFQANHDILMPAANIVRCVGINNVDSEEYECFDTLDEVISFIEKNKIAPYAWKNCVNNKKYNIDSFRSFFNKPSVSIEDDKIAKLVFGDISGSSE